MHVYAIAIIVLLLAGCASSNEIPEARYSSNYPLDINQESSSYLISSIED